MHCAEMIDDCLICLSKLQIRISIKVPEPTSKPKVKELEIEIINTISADELPILKEKIKNEEVNILVDNRVSGIFIGKELVDKLKITTSPSIENKRVVFRDSKIQSLS